MTYMAQSVAAGHATSHWIARNSDRQHGEHELAQSALRPAISTIAERSPKPSGFMPATATRRSHSHRVGDNTNDHASTERESMVSYSAMNLSLGVMDRQTVLLMVDAAREGDWRVINARKLIEILSAAVLPSDPMEAARFAWESVKRDWRSEWPAPVSMIPSIHAGMEGERVLRITVTVSSVDEAHRAKYRSDIAYALTTSLRELGVGLDLSLAADHDIVIVGGQ